MVLHRISATPCVLSTRYVCLWSFTRLPGSATWFTYEYFTTVFLITNIQRRESAPISSEESPTVAQSTRERDASGRLGRSGGQAHLSLL
ncbi:hypothetical protein J6590_025134 [Homalodisca vitripennis]|nr:hypothetical protein J6590_025134 [Homalodisca vitripennis]